MKVGTWSQCSSQLAVGWPTAAGGRQLMLDATGIRKGFSGLDKESGVENWKWLGKGLELCAKEILLRKGACDLDNMHTWEERLSLGFRSGNRNLRKMRAG